ncbi:MAG: sigma-70 family RNA polymerase sigma factor, partial [Planctomycetes bacterium]|nr:sigma-70 family RNA polymerase sigma factor [Planctomycetota bacterium]
MTHEELLSHQRFVRELARRLLADDSAADDVSQDAMVAALTTPPRQGSLRAWLTTVVRNLVRRGARAGRRRDARERAVARPEAIPPDHDSLERLAWHRQVVDAVLALEEPYRRTVVLRHYESLPPREIGRLMGVPAATVRTRLYRAYALLRASLGAGDEWRAGLLVLLLPAPGRGAIPGALLMSTKAKLGTVVVAALALVAALHATRSPARGGAPRAGPEVAQSPAAPPGSPEPTLPPAALPVTIDRDRDLHGVVVDGADTPVPNALVETIYQPWQRARLGPVECAEETVNGPSTRTAADGSFAVRLRAGDSVMLRVSATGFATTRSPARQAGERVRIMLSRGAAVCVRVIDAGKSTAVEGAVVTLRPGYLHKNRDWDLILEQRRATTDAGGACRFEDIEAPVE